MILTMESRIFRDGELICTVELEQATDPEKRMDLMVSILEVWEGNIFDEHP